MAANAEFVFLNMEKTRSKDMFIEINI